MEADGEPGNEVAKKSGSKLPLILALVNTLAIGGLAAFMVLGKAKAPVDPKDPKAAAALADKASAEEGDHAEGGEQGDKEEGDAHGKGDGPVIELGTLIVNLRDPGGERYLRTKLSLELDSPETQPEAEKRLSQIRYQINMLLAGQRVADVQGPENMESLRKSMVKKANATLSKGRIVGVWPDEWIVQ